MANIPGDGPIRAKSASKKKPTTSSTSKYKSSKPSTTSKSASTTNSKSKASSKPRTTPRPTLTSTKKAFSSSKKSRTSSRIASKELTNTQSETASSLTGPPTSGRAPASAFNDFTRNLPEEDRRAIQESREARAEVERDEVIAQLSEEDRRFLEEAGRPESRPPQNSEDLRNLPEEDRRAIEEANEAQEARETEEQERLDQLLARLPEEDRQAVREAEEAKAEEERQALIARLPEADQQAIREGEQIADVTEQVAQADSPEEQVEIIREQLESGDIDPNRLLENATPEVLQNLTEADQEVVAATIADISNLVDENEDYTEIVAAQLAENPPQNFPGLVEGLATASADGQSDLAQAFAQELREAEVPQAEAIQQAANLEGAVTDIQNTVVAGEPATSLAATERITAAIDGAPPEVAQALIAQLESNGSLRTLTSNLGEASLDNDGPGTWYPDGTDLLAPLPDDANPSGRESFDRVIAQLSNASSIAGNDTTTELLGTRIADSIGDDIGRFDEAFELSVANGYGAGLAGDVAQRVHAAGEVNSSANLVEGIERGADTFLNNFDHVADRVDESNSDLGYLITQWGPLYGDNTEALDAEIVAFREGRPEYEQLNELSANVGQDLETLRELQSLFPDKQHLKDRELDLLAEAPRFGSTENGKRALAEAVVRSGSGEQSFVDRFMDDDFRQSLSDGELEDLGLENFDQFKDLIGQQTLTASMGLLVEAAQSGDHHKMEMLGDGLVNQSELLGEDSGTLREIVDAQMTIADSAYGFAGGATDAASDRVDRALANLEELTGPGNLRNAETGAKFRTGAALLGVGAASGALLWHQALADGELTLEEGAVATIANAETLAGGLETLANFRGGSLAGVSSDIFAKGANVFAVAGLAIDTVGLVNALNNEDYAQAGISSVGIAGGVATLLGATGVGLGLGLGAAALGLAYGQYNKVKASNRFETEEAERFIAGALEVNGFEGDIDAVTHHFRNADSEGRQTGVLIQQAAERGGIDPGEFLVHIANQGPDAVLDIVEAGHGVDPEGDGLASLPQADPSRDSEIGVLGPRGRVHSNYRPHTVEGFLIWLDQQGYIERNSQGEVSLN